MSTTADAKTTYTPDALLAMPDGKNYELVDGNLVERNIIALSSLVAANVLSVLHDHCKPTNLAWVFGADCGYQCFPDRPNRVRKPDVSCVRQDRLPVAQLEEGFIRIAPDLAVEVVSPNDLAYEVDEKVDEYLGAGVPLVWVINPQRRRALVHRADGSTTLLREPDELSGEAVLPGFRCRVGDLFPTAPAPAPEAGPAA